MQEKNSSFDAASKKLYLSFFSVDKETFLNSIHSSYSTKWFENFPTPEQIFRTFASALKNSTNPSKLSVSQTANTFAEKFVKFHKIDVTFVREKIWK